MHKRALISRLGVVAMALLMSVSASAQANKDIVNGNTLYDQQKYKEAEADYTKALANDPNNTAGLFNLGNTLYQQKKYDSSRKVMAATANTLKDKNGKAAANYNIGNTYMSQQKWEDAVNAYKQTLRNNPGDMDAKYNLSYAEEMLKKKQQQDKDKQNKDKQNKDKQDKDKNKQDKQSDKDKKDDKNKDQQPQNQPNKMNQQQADNILNALEQDEKKLQEKMKAEKGSGVKMQKDW